MANYVCMYVCSDYMKPFVRNAQNGGKTNHKFCTRINHQLRHCWVYVRFFFVKNKIVIMPQLPYSPDLATADFFLFARLKTAMKGKRFDRIKDIKEKSKQKPLAIP